jgi:iron complex outermembrane recepter protein
MFKTTKLATGLLVACGGLLLSAGAHAQQQLERVEITGSSIKRVDAEAAVPVTVIRREEIERTGANTVADLMAKVSVNNGGGYQTSAALGDAARPGFAGASLRALGSNNTLVLLNGRRLAIYAFDGGAVNLNDIPLEGIERIEILRDGASSIYGSDAIGGVINLITRKDFKGGLVGANMAKAQARGGDEKQVRASLGYGDIASQGFNVFLTAGHYENDAIKAKDRDFARTAYRPDLGVNRLSSNAFPANAALPGLASPAGNFFNGGNGCLPPTSFGTSATDRRCRFDYASVIDIAPETTRDSLFVRGTTEIAGQTIAAEYALARNKYLFRISPTPASEATTFNGDPLLLPASSPYYPTAWLTANYPSQVGQPLDLYYRSVEAGPRSNQVKSDQQRFVLSADGQIGKWDYNVGFLTAESKATERYVGGYLYESKLLPAFATGVINPFGPNDAAGTAALLATQVLADVRTSTSKRSGVDGKISGEIFNLPAGAVSMAVGGEYRKETYNDNPSAILGAGDIIGGAGSQLPVSGDRNVTAVFGEVIIPVTKTLEGTLSARYDKYSDFGNTTNPKASLSWKATDSVKLRTSVGTGFRAPTLDNLFSQQTQTNTAGAYNDPFYDSVNFGSTGYSHCDGPTPPQAGSTEVFDGRFCNAQLTVLQGGNKLLKPEESKQFSLGLVWDVTRDVSLTLDYFNIEQKNLLGIISADTKLSDFIAKFNPLTQTSTSQYSKDIATRVDSTSGATVIDHITAVLDNLGSQRTSGIDFSFRSKLPASDMGRIGLNFDGTYLIEQKSKNVGDSGYGDNVVGIYARNGAVLRLKHRSEITWDYSGMESSLAYNWQSSYLDYSGTRRVSAYKTWDLALGYHFGKDIRVTGGIQNLFDAKPGKSNQNDYFQVGYDPANTNPRGRAFLLGAEYKFF